MDDYTENNYDEENNYGETAGEYYNPYNNPYGAYRKRRSVDAGMMDLISF